MSAPAPNSPSPAMLEALSQIRAARPSAAVRTADAPSRPETPASSADSLARRAEAAAGGARDVPRGSFLDILV